MRPALLGELLQVFTPEGSPKVPWTSNWKAATGLPVTWYQARFPKPTMGHGEVLLFDATGMGRGHLFLNGRDLGRYWLILMNDGSGRPTQHLYHIPLDWLVEGTNVLTLGESLGATDASLPRLVKRKMVPGAGQLDDETCPL